MRHYAAKQPAGGKSYPVTGGIRGNRDCRPVKCAKKEEAALLTGTVFNKEICNGKFILLLRRQTDCIPGMLYQ